MSIGTLLSLMVSLIALPPNKKMERTCQNRTFLAFARKSPFCHAAHL